MIQFIIKRIGYGFLVLLGVILIVFFLFNYLPINSARLTLGQRADNFSVAAIEKEFHLNEPWHKRLLLYVNDISPISLYKQSNSESLLYLEPGKYKYTKLVGFGKEWVLVAKVPYFSRSFQTRRRVSEVLAERIPPTAILAFTSIVLASIIGIILGVLSAIYHNKLWDNISVTLSVVGISQPSYFSATILGFLFGFLWHKYTGLNMGGPLIDIADSGPHFGEKIIVWKNLILPAVALGIRPIAIVTQLTRSSMLDVLSQDYIRTAKAKGLSYYKVLFKHSLRNALNPVVTSITGWFASLLAGAFFVEWILNYKGLGHITVESLKTFDFPIVMGSVLFTATVFVVVNIFVDILYAILDPRISVKGS